MEPENLRGVDGREVLDELGVVLDRAARRNPVAAVKHELWLQHMLTEPHLPHKRRTTKSYENESRHELQLEGLVVFHSSKCMNFTEEGVKFQ